MYRNITDHIIYGFRESDFLKEDWNKIKDYIPLGNVYPVNNNAVINGNTYSVNKDTVVGISLSRVKGLGVSDWVDVKPDTLEYLRRTFTEGIFKNTGIYIPDSLYRIIHITVDDKEGSIASNANYPSIDEPDGYVDSPIALGSEWYEYWGRG